MPFVMSLFAANERLFSQQAPELWKALTREKSAFGTLPGTARSGDPTLALLTPNGPLDLHSRYQPRREAVGLIQSIDLQADHFVLLGLGLGYHLLELCARKAPEARILVCEPDWGVARESMHHLPWKELLDQGVTLFVGGDEDAFSETVLTFVNVILFSRLEILEFPGEKTLYGPLFRALRQRLDREIQTLMYDLQTRLAEDAMVGRNYLRNLPLMLQTRPAEGLRGIFHGVPGIIIGAGPSLDGDILDLHQVRNRACIIAVDTALKPLLAAGIQPHFTVTVDPSHKNYRHLLGTEQRLKFHLLAEGSVAPTIFRDFTPHIFTTLLDRPLPQQLEAAMGPIGQIPAWGSVISLAFNAALSMGLGPIAFLGQDFAYSQGRHHCRHSTWQEQWRQGRHLASPLLLEQQERASIDNITRSVEVPDIHGRHVISSDKMLLYKNYLVRLIRQSGVPVVNCSSQGALTEIPHLPFRHFLRDSIRSQQTFDPFLPQRLPLLKTTARLKQLRTYLQENERFFTAYHDKIRLQLEHLPPADCVDQDRLLQQVSRAERLRNELYQTSAHGDLMEMWSQRPIFTHLRKLRKIPDAPQDRVLALRQASEDYFSSLEGQCADLAQRFKDARRALEDGP